MDYSTHTSGDVTVESWLLESGYEVRLVTLEGFKTTLTVQHPEEGILFIRAYEFWQRYRAQEHAEALAKFGSASVAA